MKNLTPIESKQVTGGSDAITAFLIHVQEPQYDPTLVQGIFANIAGGPPLIPEPGISLISNELIKYYP